MCKEYLKIKSKNPYGIKENYIPCGKCSECRKNIKAEWTNRAKAEIEEYHMHRKYNVGFITLTYHDKALPHIPKKFLIDKKEKIPCFNYEHIKKFIQTIKKHLFDKYKLTDGYRFIITSELGEKKHRPHYHGLLLFHPTISHEKMYQIVQDAWTGTQHQIKNNKKRHTKRWRKGIIAPYENFIPKDNYACGGYVAKYICKDIEFERTIDGKLVKMGKKWKNELRHYTPFHKQSMGFGRKITETRKDKDLMQMLTNGIQITGAPKQAKTPKYIHDKILFTTQKKYNLKTHKFETIRKYTKFYYDHKKEVYENKLKGNIKLFEDLRNESYYKKHIMNDKVNERLAIRENKAIYSVHTPKDLAYFYTLYYGINYERCKKAPPEEILFNRVNPCADMEEYETIERDYYESMHWAISTLMEPIHLTKSVKRTEEEEKDDRIRGFWQTRQ